MKKLFIFGIIKLEISKTCKQTQFSNIKPISFTVEVLKFDKFNEIKEEQL